MGFDLQDLEVLSNTRHGTRNICDNLKSSYASSRQAHNIVRTAIIPSLANAFASIREGKGRVT
eukprot:483153-Pelagomonas_calceolata.AAC.1